MAHNVRFPTRTPEQLHREALRRCEPNGDCYLADFYVPCDGKVQSAHYPIPKSTLKLRNVILRSGVSNPSVLIADARNGMWLCPEHHHLVDEGSVVIAREDLPVRFRFFEEQFGLAWLTDKLYARRLAYSPRVWRRQ